jgi:hypothetical protein
MLWALGKPHSVCFVRFIVKPKVRACVALVARATGLSAAVLRLPPMTFLLLDCAQGQCVTQSIRLAMSLAQVKRIVVEDIGHIGRGSKRWQA